MSSFRYYEKVDQSESYTAMFRKSGLFILTIFLLLDLSGCEELDLVLKTRTPSFLKGNPKVLVLTKKSQTEDSDILSEAGWRPLRLFEELPEKYALQTAQNERVQIILKDSGILEVEPESLVLLLGYKMKDVKILQGKIVFIKLPHHLKQQYRGISGENKKQAIAAFRKKYLSRKQGMFYMRNPFRFSTAFSSAVARKGKTFTVVVDTNHELDHSRFRLAKLQPSFVRIKNKESFKGTYRYMAVTGLDIYERVHNISYSAEARDLTGNWVKIHSTIPTENYRVRLMKGKRLRPESGFSANCRKYKKRYYKELRKKFRKKGYRRRYYRIMARRNRRLGFYWKWRRVFSQGRAIRRSRKFFSRLLTSITQKKYWDGQFRIPTGGVITSGYGRYRYYFGGRSSCHKAIDIAAPVGTSLTAPNRGKIVYTGFNPTRGLNLVIDHGLGVYTCFFHLKESFVRRGDIVTKGDIIASMGNSGLSSGPHLHWEMWVNGRQINPMDWVKNAF